MPFSRKARALAAGFKGQEIRAVVVDEAVLDDTPSLRGSMKARQQEQAEIAKLPAKIPLDRKRGVPIDDMSDEELDRARTQARNRVERTQPSADRTRYETQLAAAESALKRRHPSAPVEHEDVDEVEDDLSTVVRDLGEDLEDDSPPGFEDGPNPAAFGISFAPDPRDTPGSN